MKKIILILLLSNTITNAQKLINTSHKYSYEIERYNEDNDCSVRTIAEAFDIKYVRARFILQSYGRKKGVGMAYRNYYNAVTKSFPEKIYAIERVPKYTANHFISKIAEDGYTYILITSDHTFIIQQYGGHWQIKGNYGDQFKEILQYIKIKN
jgi:hypothetical protein